MQSRLHTLQHAAHVLYGERGSWSYAMWTRINQRFWGGTLLPGPIHWGLTAGCSFGWFLPDSDSGRITIHEALTGTAFDDWVMADRSRERTSWDLPASYFGLGTALGTLLHESMHQAHHQRKQSYGTDRLGNREPHHNAVWVAECQRIAPMIGLPTLTWPIYIDRKESIPEVISRLGEAQADLFTRSQLANRRQWISVPTIDGEEVDPRQWDGPPIASTEEICCFPRATYQRLGIAPADRIPLILGGDEGAGGGELRPVPGEVRRDLGEVHPAPGEVPGEVRRDLGEVPGEVRPVPLPTPSDSLTESSPAAVPPSPPSEALTKEEKAQRAIAVDQAIATAIAQHGHEWPRGLQSAIAKQHGLSSERIRQIKVEAIAAMG